MWEYRRGKPVELLYSIITDVLDKALGDSGGVEVYIETETECDACGGQGFQDDSVCWVCGGSGKQVYKVPLLQTLREIMEEEDDS